MLASVVKAYLSVCFRQWYSAVEQIKCWRLLKKYHVQEHISEEEIDLMAGQRPGDLSNAAVQRYLDTGELF